MTRDEALLLAQHEAASPVQILGTYLTLAVSKQARERSRIFNEVSRLFAVSLADDDVAPPRKSRPGIRATRKLVIGLALIALITAIAWHDVSSGALHAFLTNGFGGSCK